MGQSEVACIRHQIEQELEAMHRGMYAIVAGVARQHFILTRMERVGVIQDKLAMHVGDEEALRVVCETYVAVMEQANESC